MKIELFKYTHANTRYWCAEADYDANCIHITHGVLGGAMQSQIEDVDINQSGRDIYEQIDLQMESRAKRKMDIGYRHTIEESKASTGNTVLGYHRPMLAKRLDQLNDVDYRDCYVQMKYDGHRCLVTRTSNGLVAYSRNGRPIKTIDHILAGIHIPMGMTIDGELYDHGTKLQTISSYVKKKQFGTNSLKYIVYDVVTKDPYNVRYNMIENFDLGKFALVAPTDKHVKQMEIKPLLDTAIASGYEGLMLRQCRFPYEPGKRSKALVKVKAFLDDEFKVVDVNPSADGWAVLVCETSEGIRFSVTAPGDMFDKTSVLRHALDYIGKFVTVKYANITESGVPFHPVAVCWSEDK